MVPNERLPIDNTRLVIDGENIPFGAYQAIYHKITKKTESLRQSYKDAYDIGHDNLADLNIRLKQLLQQYQVAGQNVEISHSLSGGQSRNFSAFEKFSIADNSIQAITKSIVYEINFLIILPAELPESEGIPQRYKISLNCDSQDAYDDPEEEFELFPLLIRLRHSHGISLNLEYCDYSVALAIKSVIDQWVKSLHAESRSSFQRWLIRNRYNSSLSIPQIISIVPFFAALYFCYSVDYIDIKSSVILLLFTLLFSKLTYMISEYFWDTLVHGSAKAIPKTTISITNGDIKRGIRRKKEASNYNRIIFGSAGLILTFLERFPLIPVHNRRI